MRSRGVARGYFLLTNLLLDRLKASAPARVVNVASGAHSFVPGIDWEDVEGKRRYQTFRAYAQSKLANILFTQELARRLDGTGVTANVLHPGFVSTSFFLNKGRLGWLFKQLARVFSMAPEAGARTSVYLATSPAVANVSGGYFVKCEPGKLSRAADDPEAARRLWALSEEATGLGS
jgi:NAD(P)-dependent dehydrogenase (short-subunit alcohol dehydrogenase family)